MKIKLDHYKKVEFLSGAGKNLTVKHVMLFTMIDGKICNAATETTSTMKCYICGATSKNFNDLSKTKEINPGTLKFGLSVLHARIRLSETLLHLSYKLPAKKLQLRSESDKAIAKERKLNTQKAFRERMGLIDPIFINWPRFRKDLMKNAEIEDFSLLNRHSNPFEGRKP